MPSTLEVFHVRVTVYRRNRPPLVFGLGSEAAHSDLLDVVIVRQLGAPAAVQVTLPGRTSPGGVWWSDEIGGMDFVQIDATIRRNPDAFSDPWRTLFFGYVSYVSRGEELTDGSLTRNCVMYCTCQMGILATQNFNYWRGLPGTFGGDLSGKLERFVEGKRAEGKLALFNSGALVLQFVMEYWLYRYYPLRRTIGGREYPWSEMHGYRFESDDRAVNIALETFAPQSTTWLEGVMSAVDAPHFYEVYLDTVPLERVDGHGVHEGGGGASKSHRVAKSPPVLTFKDQALGRRADVLVVRPKPFPVYDDENGGYDGRAWDNLPTFVAREGVGHYSDQLQRGIQNVYTYFSAFPSGFLGNPTEALKSDAALQVIVDVDKFFNLGVGYKPLDVITRRTPVSVTAEGDFTESSGEGRAGINPGEQQDANLYISFLRSLNQTLFSYHQFNDRFYGGTVAGPGDLRLELGSRYVFDGLLGYVEGYSHRFTPRTASTTVTLHRALSVHVYQGEFRETLGRKRRDENVAPVTGALPGQAAVEEQRKRGL